MNNQLLETAKILIQDHPTQLSVYANLASLIYGTLPELNWVGFYLNDGNRLILGPFMGKPATTEIPFERGVCGECVRKKKRFMFLMSIYIQIILHVMLHLKVNL